MGFSGRRFLALLCLLAGATSVYAASPFAGYYKGVIRMRVEALGTVNDTDAYFLTMSVDNNGNLVTETIGTSDMQNTVRYYPYVTGRVNDNGTIDLNEGAPFSPPYTPLPAPSTQVSGNVMKITSANFIAGPATQRLTLLATNISAIPSNSAPRINFVTPASTNIYENLPLSLYASFIHWADSVSVQWRRNGQPISAGTNVFNFETGYLIPAATEADEGDYTVVVTNPYGSVTSRVCRVTVSPAPPVAPGGLDPLFDPAAGPVASLGGTLIGGSIASIVPLADGNVMVGGYWDRFNNQPSRGLARLNSAGGLDTTYLPDLTNAVSPTNLAIKALAVQPDGKLLVSWFFGFDRLNPDGSIDPTFSRVTLAFPEIIKLQSDGKILIAGTSFGLARLNPSGTVDTNFARGQSKFSGSVRALVVEPDDKVTYVGELNYVAPGNVFRPVGTNCVTRLFADGSLDTSFIAPSNNTTGLILAMDRQPDGKYIIGGNFIRIAQYNNLFGIARLNANGSVDTSFQSGLGVRTVVSIPGFSFNIDGAVYGIHCMPDGKTYIGGGFQTYASTGRTNIARLNANGSVDSNFNPGASHPDGTVRLIEPLANGKIYIGGDFTKVGQTPRTKLARIAGSTPAPLVRPTITTQPANRNVPLGGSTTFTVAANNATTYAWLFAGEPLPFLTAAGAADLTNVFGANTATLVVSNAYAANQGTYRCVVTGPGGSVTSSPANLTITGIPAPDTQPPTVAITTPKGPMFTTLDSSITISGTAKDNGSVTQVVARIGSGSFVPADGTLTWSATFALEPGTNQIAVKALDDAGFESSLTTIAIVRKVSSPLDIVVNGNGVIAPNLDNTLQEIGKSLSLTATPAKGWFLSNWLVGSSPVLGAKLTFVMQSNLVVTANFVTNRFIASQGVFNGLALDSAAPTHEQSGFATLRLTSAGAFSGSLLYGGKKVALKGAFDLAGNANLNITAPLPLAISLALQPAGDVVLGTISDNGRSIPVRMNRVSFSKTAPANGLSGLYTLLVQPATNNSISIGDGFGTATVDAAGNVALKGILADNSPIAQKVGVSPTGDWPFFASLYAGKGSIIGWVKIDSNAPNALLATDGLHWTRPAQAKQPFASGFTNEWAIEGSPYPLPVTGRVLSMTDGVTILANGNLSQNITNDIRLEIDNKITNLSSNALKITVTSAKGSFKGTVTPPAGGKPVAIQGAILPRQNRGGGFFSGTNSTGQVYLGE